MMGLTEIVRTRSGSFLRGTKRVGGRRCSNDNLEQLSIKGGGEKSLSSGHTTPQRRNSSLSSTRTSSPSPDTGQADLSSCNCLGNLPPPCNTPEDQPTTPLGGPTGPTPLSFSRPGGKQPLGLFLIVPAVHHRQQVKHFNKTVNVFYAIREWLIVPWSNLDSPWLT